MINQVALTGNLASEVELRQTANGVQYAHFRIAVTRNFANKDGERDSDFINCVAWRQTGEAMHKYVRKGSRVGITGRIRASSYDDAKGQRVYRTEVIVEDFTSSKSAKKPKLAPKTRASPQPILRPRPNQRTRITAPTRSRVPASASTFLTTICRSKSVSVTIACSFTCVPR